MYRLLIVEDEKWEREGLQGFLDWKKLGIEVAGCASNGIEGKKTAEEIQPHIIITDIKMPLMDGIQMSREICAFLPETYIIILSGYDEFEYARQAFDFHASAYLLKPVNKKTLEEAVLNVLKKLDEKKRHQNEKIKLESQWLEYTRKNCGYLLVDFLNQKTDFSYISGLSQIKRIAEYKNKAAAVFAVSVNPDKTVYEENINADSILNVVGIFEAILGEEGVVLADGEHQNEIVVLMDAPSDRLQMEEKLLRIVSKIKQQAGIYSIVGIGKTVDSIELLPLSFRQARKALELRFLANYGELLFYSDIMESAQKNWNLTRQLIGNVDLISKNVVKSIMAGDLNSGIGYIDEFLSKLREYPSESKILLNCFIMNIVNEINMVLPNDAEGVFVSLFNPQKGVVDLSVLGSLSHTRKYLAGFLSRIAVNMKKDCGENNVARMVLKIIEERFMEELTLKRVSEEIHLYPYYIGSIFREYTGKSFNQYLNDYRLDKAREILDRKNMKICELAKAVGISNTSYFCSLFREKFGISPGEYVEVMGRRHVSV